MMLAIDAMPRVAGFNVPRDLCCVALEPAPLFGMPYPASLAATPGKHSRPRVPAADFAWPARAPDSIRRRSSSWGPSSWRTSSMGDRPGMRQPSSSSFGGR